MDRKLLQNKTQHEIVIGSFKKGKKVIVYE